MHMFRSENWWKYLSLITGSEKTTWVSKNWKKVYKHSKWKPKKGKERTEQYYHNNVTHNTCYEALYTFWICTDNTTQEIDQKELRILKWNFSLFALFTSNRSGLRWLTLQNEKDWISLPFKSISDLTFLPQWISKSSLSAAICSPITSILLRRAT